MSFAFKYKFYPLALALTMMFMCAVSAMAGAWSKQKSGTLAWLHAVYFLDESKGWAVGGSGVLLATTDGGENWKKLRAPGEDAVLDIYFADEQRGWIVCERSIYLLRTKDEQRSYLMKTADGGETWRRVNLSGEPDARLLRVLMIADGHGWVFGEGGMVFVTNDGGASWTKRRTPTRHVLFGGAILDATQLWLVGAGATAIQSKDGGETWRIGNVLGITESVRFNAVSFVDRARGWAVGNAGSVFLTADGGKTWQAQSSNVAEDLFDVKFIDASEGWTAGAEGVLLHTTDGGFHWKAEQTGTTHPFDRIFFAGRKMGWAVGFGGTILSYNQNATDKAPALKQAPVLKGAVNH